MTAVDAQIRSMGVDIAHGTGAAKGLNDTIVGNAWNSQDQILSQIFMLTLSRKITNKLSKIIQIIFFEIIAFLNLTNNWSPSAQGLKFILSNLYKGQVWTTYSDISGYKFGIIFNGILTEDYQIFDWECNFPTQNTFVYKEWPEQTQLGENAFPVTLSSEEKWGLHHVSPVIRVDNYNIVIIGEQVSLKESRLI